MRAMDERETEARRGGRRGWLIGAVGAALLAGCVDVPERMPVGGDPVDAGDAGEDAAPDAMADGFAETPDAPVDRDDPDAPRADAEPDPPVGPPDRPEGGEPGRIEPPPPMVEAAPDPRRCPDGGHWLPGLDACALIEAHARLPAPRFDVAAAALPDGRLFVGGGALEGGAPLGETWFAVDGAWVEGPALPHPVAGGRAVAVGDDRLWIVGGRGASSRVQRVVAEGGRPAVAAEVGALAQPRSGGFTVARLGDGRVVAVGGETLGGIADAEVVQPLEAAVEALRPMTIARRGHAAAVDPDGGLWIVGGRDRGDRVRFLPEVLAPDADRWAVVGGPAGWETERPAAAVSGDRVLVAGGFAPDGRPLRRAGVVDPVLGAWREVGGLNVGQPDLTLTPLGPDGALLAVGPASVEVFDPVEEAFRWIALEGPLVRLGHAALPTADGAVLVVGGLGAGRVLDHAYTVRLVPAMAVEDDAQPAGEGDADGR